MADGTRSEQGPERPAWARIAVPEPWTERTYPTDYRAGYLAGWVSDKARCPILPAWPGTPKRREAWEAGKQAGAQNRRHG